MASPIAGVATAACSSGTARDPVDASLPEAPDATPEGGEDATIDSTAATDASAPPDREACGATLLDASIENTQDGCVAFGRLPCGLPPTAKREGCLVDLPTCVPLCNGIGASVFLYCQLAPVSCDDAGDVLDAESVIECLSCNGISGRRPLGFVSTRPVRRTPAGDYFAAMAHLEAASVAAFRQLAAWLDIHRAPRRLSRAARRFVRDEQLHARAARRLARRFGGVTSRPRVRRTCVPTLLALIEDDAIEGCVNETFGALLATWQAERATDARIRRTLQRIAADETRHAALAWEILAWGMGRLSGAQRRRIDAALAGAAVALESNPSRLGNLEVRQLVGYPAPKEERRLASEFARLVARERQELGLPG